MFDQLMRQAIREEMQAVLRELMADSAPRLQTERFISVQEAAQIASVGEATVREWIKRGDLRGYRAGKLIRVSHAELVEMMKRGPVRTRPKEPDTGVQVVQILSRRKRS